MNKYKRFEKHLKKSLQNYYKGKVPDSILQDIQLEFESLSLEVPYIGGRDNPFYTNMLDESVLGLALYKVIKTNDIQIEDIGKILLDTFTSRVYSWSWALRKMMNNLLFSGWIKSILKSRSEKSQKHLYETDWVMEYVDGKDGEYDYGVNYLECAICKFYHTHHADEMIKYNCQCDYPLSDAIGWGLVRTMTIADGKQKCDFRFTKSKVKFLKQVK